MNHASRAERNLQVVPHALLNRHHYPAVLHHWTEDEFRKFLSADRYPTCTYRGHEDSRRQAVVKAIAQGLHVPPEVTEEAPELLKEGRAAQGYAAISDSLFEQRAKMRKELLDEFEKAIGYWHSTPAYLAGVKEILKDVLARDNDQIRKPVQFGKWEIRLSVDKGRAPRWGSFGILDQGRQKSLHILSNAGQCWTIHKVEWQTVNDALFELMSDGSITLDQLWFLMDTGWVPDQMSVSRVQVVQSAQAEALAA